MKKLITVLISILIAGVLSAQTSNWWRYRMNLHGGVKVGNTIIKTGVNKTGSLLIPIDSISGDNTTTPTLFKVWRGGVQLIPSVPAGAQILGVALADSGKTNGTGYTTPQDLAVATNIGFTIPFEPIAYATPIDATLYYYGTFSTIGTGLTSYQVEIPVNCTLIGYTLVTTNTAVCTAETGTLSVRINNTTDVQLSNVVTWGVGGAYILNYFRSMALNTNLSAGDLIVMKFLTPTWVTNATSIRMSTILYFRNR